MPSGGGYDYTLVLSGGKAYENSTEGKEISTSDLETMGLVFSNDVWTMNNFNFSTAHIQLCP